MTGTVEKIKDVLHMNKDHSTTHTTTGHTTTGHSTTGHSTGHSGVPEGTAGPHSSRVANAADPRIDSDLDSSRTGHAGGVTGHSTTAGYGSTNAGPHDSNLANKADPRIDSDRDGRHVGQGAAAGYGSTGTHTTHTTGSTNAGPHNSNMANKLDPRVDSDRDGSHLGQGTGAGYGTTGTHSTHTTGTHATGTHTTGTHGGISHSTNAGPHDSNLANKADPRVDSDLDGSGNRHGANTHGGVFGASGSHATPGSGTAQNTAGPHNSDMLNKLDPRVDADLDGSKTIGGNKTHA